jgi:hypothetical protein
MLPPETRITPAPAPLSSVHQARTATIRERHQIVSWYEAESHVDRTEARPRSHPLVIVILVAALAVILAGAGAEWVERFGMAVVALLAIGVAVWEARR